MEGEQEAGQNVGAGLVPASFGFAPAFLSSPLPLLGNREGFSLSFLYDSKAVEIPSHYGLGKNRPGLGQDSLLGVAPRDMGQV